MRKAQSCQKIIKKRTFQNDGKTKEAFRIFLMEEILKGNVSNVISRSFMTPEIRNKENN